MIVLMNKSVRVHVYCLCASLSASVLLILHMMMILMIVCGGLSASLGGLCAHPKSGIDRSPSLPASSNATSSLEEDDDDNDNNDYDDDLYIIGAVCMYVCL